MKFYGPRRPECETIWPIRVHGNPWGRRTFGPYRLSEGSHLVVNFSFSSIGAQLCGPRAPPGLILIRVDFWLQGSDLGTMGPIGAPKGPIGDPMGPIGVPMGPISIIWSYFVTLMAPPQSWPMSVFIPQVPQVLFIWG